MGEFDKCHTCMGIFIDFDLIFGINLHYFAVYAHISPIMLGFGFFKF